MSDGGGVVPAARKIVYGRSRIARPYLLLANPCLFVPQRHQGIDFRCSTRRNVAG